MAKAMSERDARCSRSRVDCSDRRGSDSAVEEMRGQARRNFQMPRDMAAAPAVEEELALQ